MHCAEAISKPGVPPEDIALLASRSLLAEIRRGGCTDRQHQVLVLLLMVLGSEDGGRCRMGEPTTRTYVCAVNLRQTPIYPPHRIQFLRDIKESFGTAFKIVPADPADESTTDLLYSCYGVGYVNANRSLA